MIWWNCQKAHEELPKRKHKFGLIYSYSLESGVGLPEFFSANTMQEIRDKLVELTTNIPTWWGEEKPGPNDHFHAMHFEIIRSYHIDCR